MKSLFGMNDGQTNAEIDETNHTFGELYPNCGEFVVGGASKRDRGSDDDDGLQEIHGSDAGTASPTPTRSRPEDGSKTNTGSKDSLAAMK